MPEVDSKLPLGELIEPRVLDLSRLMGVYDRIEQFVREHRIRVAGNSRIREYGRVLKQLQGSASQRAKVDRWLAHQVTLELDQIDVVLDGLASESALPRRFQSLVRGPTTTFLAGDKDPGRDEQFELFLAGTIARGGLTARLEEPDLVVDVNGGELGIAAKRPRAPQSLPKMIHDGSRQIERSGRPGIIAFDLSLCPIEGLLLATFADNPRKVTQSRPACSVNSFKIIRS